MILQLTTKGTEMLNVTQRGGKRPEKSPANAPRKVPTRSK